MSWNPRRFVQAAGQVLLGADAKRMLTGDQTAEIHRVWVWVTDEASARIVSAVKNDIIIDNEGTFPPKDGVVIGLQSPMKLSCGDASVFVITDVWTQKMLLEHAMEEIGFTSVGQHPNVRVGEYPNCVYIYTRDMHRLGNIPIVAYNHGWTPDSFGPDRRLAEELAAAKKIHIFSDEESRAVCSALHATCTLLDNQTEIEATATVTYVEQVSLKKRDKRSGKRNTSDVTVIDVIRRAYAAHQPGAGVPIEHDHRWTVRGHWRMQPFGPSRVQRRRIWIDEHEAGPPDKPLIRRTRVYRLR
jgi:hypothetical protein